MFKSKIRNSFYAGFIFGFGVALVCGANLYQTATAKEYRVVTECAPLPHKKPYTKSDILGYLEGIDLTETPERETVAKLWTEVCDEMDAYTGDEHD